MRRPIGVSLLSAFFAFGTLMSGLTAFMLLFPGSFLDHLWRLNPQALQGFLTIGSWAVLLMATVCAACASAAVGLWKMALAILSVNALGDTASALIRQDWRPLIGSRIAAGMIAYLISRRQVFWGPAPPN